MLEYPTQNSTVNSRLKKDQNLQTHQNKTFFSDDHFLESVHKSFLNQTTWFKKGEMGFLKSRVDCITVVFVKDYSRQ